MIREQTEFGGCVAAEALGVPHAAVQISAFRAYPPELLAPPLDRLRDSAALPPDPTLAMLHRYLLLVPYPPRFQNPSLPLPPTAHFVRHIPFDLDHPGDYHLPVWLSRMPRRRTVYVTLGTAYNRTPGVFPAILAALSEEPINAIVTVGDQDPAAFGPQPPHIRLERYIPQSLIFPRCNLVITHGGSGTVRTAINHGLPMVILPIAADMPENARRCADRGAIQEVLNDSRFRSNAEQLRREMESLPPPEYAVELLERLARDRRPLIEGGDASSSHVNPPSAIHRKKE